MYRYEISEITRKGVSLMSVHFFYNFKEELVKKLNEQFKDKIELYKKSENEKLQLEKAEEIIMEYFKELEIELKDVVNASGGEIGFEYDTEMLAKFFIKENYLKFTKKERTIEMKIGKYDKEEDIVESTIVCYIVPGIKKCKLKKVGKIHDGSSFDENTINYYLKSVFDEE